jgi:succinyl-CoA synthetase beta subunit
MDLFEYQGKELLAAAGLAVPRSRLARSVAEAERLAADVGYPLVVKAQVLSGGRGKAGGVRFVPDQDELHAATTEMLAMTIAGKPVVGMLLEEAIEIAAEYYLAIVLDRSARRPLLIFSRQGGMDIEQVARNDPAGLQRVPIDPLLGLRDFQVRSLCLQAGLEFEHWQALIGVAQSLWLLYQSKDATLVETNPLCLTRQGSFVALDAKVSIDSNALFRHPEFALLPGADDERERRAKEAGFAYVSLDGEIGVLGNGAGLVMSLLDGIAVAGGRAANFLDVGGGATHEQIAKALEIVLSDDRVRVLLCAIFGGITRCDEVARGLLSALEATDAGLPVVATLTGTHSVEGNDLLAQAGLSNLHVKESIAGAISAAVALVAESDLSSTQRASGS